VKIAPSKHTPTTATQPGLTLTSSKVTNSTSKSTNSSTLAAKHPPTTPKSTVDFVLKVEGFTVGYTGGGREAVLVAHREARGPCSCPSP